jgi:ureidoglycolate lyase
MSLFSCFPRKDTPNGIFRVKILERHPFTTQTFTPLGLSPEDKSTKVLVIVAPSTRKAASGSIPENLPDLSKLVAFVATGGQAVTYAAGTWHAPMVVLGEKRVDFVVTQFVSGIAEEDCQEVLVGEGVGVNFEEVGPGADDGLWTKGRAKL